MTILWVVLIVLGGLLAWIASIAIAVPLVLFTKYGRIELRSREELQVQSLEEDPSNRHYPSFQKWTDARGNKHDVHRWRPRDVALVTMMFAPLVLPLLPIMGMAFLGMVLADWEADKINGRIDIRRQVRKLVVAREAELAKLVDAARKEMENL